MMRKTRQLIASSSKGTFTRRFVRSSTSLLPQGLQQQRSGSLCRRTNNTNNTVYRDNTNTQKFGNLYDHRYRFTTAALKATNNDLINDTIRNNGMTPTTKKLAETLTGRSTLAPPTPSSLSQEQKEIFEIRQRRFALAKAITLVESTAPDHRHQGDLLLSHILKEYVVRNSNDVTEEDSRKNDDNKISYSPSSFRLGIAGPPGAGKSTFIEAFGLYILNDLAARSKNSDNSSSSTTINGRDRAMEGELPFLPHKMAVVCIDPSSTVTGGSILGDKTRMIEISKHERAYVRPSANGGTFGGLSAYTHDVVSLCQAADYELVIVESVGLGQSEVEIAESVDMLVLIVPPGGGDELQGVKKGIVEVADLLIVNKADGNLKQAARSTATDYHGAVKYMRQRSDVWPTPPVLLTSAHTRDGIPEVWNEICKYRQLMTESGELEEKRRKQARYWMWKNLKDLIIAKSHSDPILRPKADAMVEALDSGAITPRVAAKEVLEFITTNGVHLH